KILRGCEGLRFRLFAGNPLRTAPAAVFSPHPHPTRPRDSSAGQDGPGENASGNGPGPGRTLKRRAHVGTATAEPTILTHDKGELSGATRCHLGNWSSLNIGPRGDKGRGAGRSVVEKESGYRDHLERSAWAR